MVQTDTKPMSGH